jgi:endonuclease/exonuclease/phosphatase family metal-dependent hydrolase
MKRIAVIFLLLFVILITDGCSGTQQINTSKAIQFPTTQTGIIKAMTFNIRVDTIFDGLNGWSTRRQLVFDTISDDAVDIIGLQEALYHQVRQIQQALPQYDHYAVGRNDGKNKGECCAIFYRKDRFTINDSGTFWFSDTPGSKDWGNLWPRICSWVHLTEKATGDGFYVYNVHLDVFSQNSRQKSVELLAKRIAVRSRPDPFIVMGDFNMNLDNPAMVYLQNLDSKTPYPRMLSAWQSLYPGQPCGGTRRSFLGPSSGPKIDHIPISDGIQVLYVKVDRRSVNGRHPSDHYPVIAEVVLENSSEKFEPLTAKTNPRTPQRN